MRYLIILSAFAFLFAGCGKDKFETKPHLTFNSVSTTELRAGQLLQFKLGFTDKEGDISNSLYVEKVVSDCGDSNWKEVYNLPGFPASSNQKGEVVFTLGFNAGTEWPDVSPKCSKDEIATFRFAIQDKENNTSDTITSPPIKIIY